MSSLVGLILPQGQGRRRSARRASDPEFQQVQAAVLRECIVNLARIKEAIDAERRRHARCGRPRQLAGPDARHQGGAADARQGTRGGDHRGDHHAAEARDAARAARAAAGLLDRLADAIVSLEYYMETLQAGRSRPLVHARQRAGLRAGARAAARPPRCRPCRRWSRAAYAQDRADHQRRRRAAAARRAIAGSNAAAPVLAAQPAQANAGWPSTPTRSS